MHPNWCLEFCLEQRWGRNATGVIGHHRGERGAFEACSLRRGIKTDFQRERRIAVDALHQAHCVTWKCIGVVDLESLNDLLGGLPTRLGVRVPRSARPTSTVSTATHSLMDDQIVSQNEHMIT